MRSLSWVAVLVVLVGPGAVRAQETAGFVVRLGADTLSVERVTRTARQVRGEMVARTPRAVYRAYTLDLAPDGAVTRFEMTTRQLGDGPGPAETRSTLAFAGDSAVSTTPRGDGTAITRVAAAPGTVPTLFGVMGLIEQLGFQARRRHGTPDTIATLTPGATLVWPAIVTERGGDTLSFVMETPVGRVGPWFMRVDGDGRLLSYRGPGTPFQGETMRLADVDMAVARDAFAGRALGPLSTRDTVRAQLGDAALWVDYGRPVRRGRTIFGNVVPWNTVWRTGANAATQFRTPVDLLVAGATVPAGTYTLWTLPTPTGWKLIVNRQTGQWGTVYDPAQDLVRVDMQVLTVTQQVERFTIAIEPEPDGAALRLSWDRTRASVPLRRKS